MATVAISARNRALIGQKVCDQLGSVLVDGRTILTVEAAFFRKSKWRFTFVGTNFTILCSKVFPYDPVKYKHQRKWPLTEADLHHEYEEHLAEL